MMSSIYASDDHFLEICIFLIIPSYILMLLLRLHIFKPGMVERSVIQAPGGKRLGIA